MCLSTATLYSSASLCVFLRLMSVCRLSTTSLPPCNRVTNIFVHCDIFNGSLTATLRTLSFEQRWRGLDGDSLVQLYDDAIAQLLDRQVPAETKTCRRRPSNAWFDDDCRRAKRQLRSTERAARCAGPISDLNSPVVQACMATPTPAILHFTASEEN